MSPDARVANTSRSDRAIRILVAIASVLFVACQWRAIHRQNVNWDEFALLARAAETIRTGSLVGGGRPGLATLMLIPFVHGCANSVTAVVHARDLWLFLTLTYLAGVHTLVRAVLPKTCHSWLGGWVAVAFLAFVPVFLRWSVQVRTDQPALMFGCWGGVALLFSTRRVPAAALAGSLIAAGYLSSQKALYLVPLLLLLFALRVTRDPDDRRLPWRRVVAILGVAALAAIAVVVLYGQIMAHVYSAPAVASVAGELATFAYYRGVFGFRAYVAMLPSLTPHIIAIGFLISASVIASRGISERRTLLFVALASLLLGSVVGFVHGGAFPYFWMTLGLFPAVAIGLAWPVLIDFFSAPIARATLGAAVAVLCVGAITAGIALRHDTMHVQRDAMAFIASDLPESARGFQTEGALFCRQDPQPFPTYFADTVVKRLSGPEGQRRAESFIQEFRDRPVSFMIANRLFSFPPPIQDFWKTHYVLYRDEVMLPGRGVTGHQGDTFVFDPVAPGRYKWITRGGPAARLSTGVDVVGDGQELSLSVGSREFRLLDDVRGGLLVLAVPDSPAPDGPPFYDPTTIHELDPLYPRR